MGVQPQPAHPSWRRVIALAATLLILAVVAICYFAGVFDKKPVPRDPLADFKTLVSKVSTFQVERDGAEDYRSEGVTYDVQKTDSLVSPYLGTLSYTQAGPYDKHEYQLLFAWQEGKWVFKSGTETWISGPPVVFTRTVKPVNSRQDLPMAVSFALHDMADERTQELLDGRR